MKIKSTTSTWGRGKMAHETCFILVETNYNEYLTIFQVHVLRVCVRVHARVCVCVCVCVFVYAHVPTYMHIRSKTRNDLSWFPQSTCAAVSW